MYVEPHVVLLGLVAREDGDPLRAALSPPSRRRTSTLPSEPVPPVMRIRLPANISLPTTTLSWCLLPPADHHASRPHRCRFAPQRLARTAISGYTPP